MVAGPYAFSGYLFNLNGSLGTKHPATESKEVWGAEPPALGDFLGLFFTTKIIYFRHVLDEILLKNLRNSFIIGRLCT